MCWDRIVALETSDTRTRVDAPAPVTPPLPEDPDAEESVELVEVSG